MPKLRNGNNGDSNPGSLDCESGILPTELPRSTGLDNIESVTVIDEYICSDHLPLRVVIRCDLATHCVSGRNKNDFIDWKTAGVHDYDKFDVKSSEYLSNVDVSVSLFNCTDQSCKLHECEIDRLYGGIIKSLNTAANDCIPRRKSGTRQQIAGWTDIVKESHEVARSDFKFWCSNGKPRHGYVYEAMRRSRSQFKYALRQCKRSEDTIKADRLAGDLLQHNVVDFWENVRNLTSNKASNSTCIDAVVGEQNIADYFFHIMRVYLTRCRIRHIRMRY